MVKYVWKNDYRFEGGTFLRGMWYFQNMYVTLNRDYIVFNLKNQPLIKIKFDDLLNKFFRYSQPNRK